ncbi:Uncharacterised protein [Klebsiella pneumoniae]|nr:Uncharacterised protein [Klebsiella pneumoniae]
MHKLKAKVFYCLAHIVLYSMQGVMYVPNISSRMLCIALKTTPSSIC